VAVAIKPKQSATRPIKYKTNFNRSYMNSKHNLTKGMLSKGKSLFSPDVFNPRILKGEPKPFMSAALFAALFAAAIFLTSSFASTPSSALNYDKIPLAQVKTNNPFIDVNGKVHAEHIVWAYQHGVTKGSPAGSNTYKPTDTVSRGSMASFLRRVIGTPGTTQKVPKFVDIKGNVHEDNIKWLASEGITTGSPKGSNTYKPLDTVNRGAMATFMYRVAGEPKYTAPNASPFVDVDKSNIHYKAIAWLKSVGLTTGSPQDSNTYKPNDAVNRGSMATFLHRLYAYLLNSRTDLGTCSIANYVNKVACTSSGGTWTPVKEKGTCSISKFTNKVDCTSQGGIWTPTKEEGTCSIPEYNNITDCMSNGGKWSSEYVLSFNINGGDGGYGLMGSITCNTSSKGCAVKLPTNKYTKDGWKFTGWSLASGASGVAYPDGASITLNKSMTLYAQWTGNTYAVTYNANGGEGTVAKASCTVSKGSSCNLPAAANGFSKDGWTFSKWTTQANGSGTSYVGDGTGTITLTGNITLHALWTGNTYKASYNGNGGVGNAPLVEQCTVTQGSTCTVTLKTNTYTKPGNDFVAWNTSSDWMGINYFAGTQATLSSDITLYAQWEPPGSQIADVYPTTGWEGDTIEITSDEKFVGVTGVTVGGSACTSHTVVNPSKIYCVLPVKASLSKNLVTVTTDTGDVDLNGVNITYFDPTRKETVGSRETSNITFDTFTAADCADMIPAVPSYDDSDPDTGQIVYLTDTRNNQTYKVKRMQDGKCWIIDHLKYRGEGGEPIVANNTIGKHNTINGNFDPWTDNNHNIRKYNNPASVSTCDMDGDQLPAKTLTGCGYFYNWYAATDGTGAMSIPSGDVDGSICPTNSSTPTFRLPKGGGDLAKNDFAVLASKISGNNNLFENNDSMEHWSRERTFQGVFSGHWSGDSVRDNMYDMYLWSSTADFWDFYWPPTGQYFYGYDAYILQVSYIRDSGSNVFNTRTRTKSDGNNIRCVLNPADYHVTFDSQGGSYVWFQDLMNGDKVQKPEDPTRGDHIFAGWYTDPEKTNPYDFGKQGSTYDFDSTVSGDMTLYAAWISIPGTQTADIYPTTGWQGDDIEIISSTPVFSNVDYVTVDGVDCTDFAINSPSNITCKLPQRWSGAQSKVAVVANETVIYAGKVTYFDPSRTERIGSGADERQSTNITFDTFTASTDCNDMDTHQTVNITDARNKQTYKVKKMQDSRCWIIDNLKYRGEATPGAVGDIEPNNSGENPTDEKKYNDPVLGTMANDNQRNCLTDNPMLPSNGSITRCGYLYNWYAATNGTGTQSLNQGEEATDSICPVGFTLPKGGSLGNFEVLDTAMGNNNWGRDNDWQGIMSGYRDSTGLIGQGLQGNFWSSTAKSMSNAYGLNFTSSNTANPTDDFDKRHGIAVRCVL
jgi:uncharacterized protein (TIGR02145 family)